MDSNESSNEAWQQNGFIDKTFFWYFVCVYVFFFLFLSSLQSFLHWKWQANRKKNEKTTSKPNENDDAKRWINGEETEKKETKQTQRQGKNTCRKQESFSRCQIDHVMAFGDWIVECCIVKISLAVSLYNQQCYKCTWLFAFV